MSEVDLLAGRYALRSVIGRGGMGTVWAATDQVLGRDVAVKILRVDAAPADALTRFQQEAQFLAKLTHPNIVTVFDFGIDDHRAWLVMELLPGPTLAELLVGAGNLPIDQVVTIARESASALAAAHDAGVIHRDIKPGNLMLDGDGRCRLLDLGVARLADVAATATAGLTQTGMILGTAHYVAPELVDGGTATPAADVYGLGATIYTLLTKDPPYQAESTIATLAQHVHAPVPHPIAARPDLPEAVDQLVVAMLAKDPASRPSAHHVVELLDDLDGPLPPPLTVTRVLPTQPATRPTVRWVAAAVAALAILAIILAVTVGSNKSQSPGHRGSGSATTPSVTPSQTPPSHSPSATPTPRVHHHVTPTTATQALNLLSRDVQRAAAVGALAPPDAMDAEHRITDLEHTLSAGKPQDVSHKIDDFAHHLADLQKQGHITAKYYDRLLKDLAQLQRLTA